MPPQPQPSSWADAHVPFYKDADRAWGAINRILSIPCAPDPAVYIDAAVKGLWHVAYNIISPDPKEIYHQLIGNSLYHDIKQGAEDTRVVKPRETSAFTRSLFTVADFVDVAAWHMFLFGSAVDGLVDFSSQLAKYAGCQNKHNPAFFSGGPYINAIADDGRFYGDDFAGATGDGVARAGPVSFTMGGGHGGFAAGTCQFTTFGGAMPVPTDTGVRDFVNGVTYDIHHSDPEEAGKYSPAHSFFKTNRMTGVSAICEVQSRYTGGDRLPLGEAFRDGDIWQGYCQTF